MKFLIFIYLRISRSYNSLCKKTSLKPMSGSQYLPDLIRLTNISGFDNRSNDVIYCRPSRVVENPSICVFFGGDVQDFKENMLSHRDNKKHEEWNLENTAKLLQNSFPDSHIVVIRPLRDNKKHEEWNLENTAKLLQNSFPDSHIVVIRPLRDNKKHEEWNLENTAKLLQNSFPDSHIVVIRPLRMEYKTFSCYENFVPCTHCGVPEHIPMHNGLQHLEMLINNISLKIQNMTDEELNEAIEVARNGLVQGHSSPQNVVKAKNIPTRTSLNLNDCDISLVGFSKGCVVLNQFLYEFDYYANDTSTVLTIIPKIKEMYWLDGGHSGGKNTWMTSRNLLESLAKLGIRILVHVTPYQIDDDRRPWIKKEEKLFSDTLKNLGVPIQRFVHYKDIPASITNHFNVLTVFRNTT